MLLHWFITFWGNLAGSLFVMAIITGYGGTFSTTAQHARVVTFATSKAITPAWHQVFLRGIGANWLVCLAAYLSFMGREFFSKVVGIWWPTFAFVMLGFDHVVANMFYIPLGIFVGTPGLTVGHYIAHSMIPALIGNIVGGGLFVGVVYWYLVRLQFLLDRSFLALTDSEYSTLPRTMSPIWLTMNCSLLTRAHSFLSKASGQMEVVSKKVLALVQGRLARQSGRRARTQRT